MTMQDPLADMLTRLRNAQMAGFGQVEMPTSRLKVAVAKVLCEEGYIDSYSTSEGDKPVLSLSLRYYQSRPVIEEIKRMSRPGLRRYCKSDRIPLVRSGLGVVIMSTNKGVITDRAARRQGVGGELLCSVF